MIGRWAVLALTAAIAGCAGMGDGTLSQQPLIKAPESREEALSIADDYAERGRWAAALAVLDRAIASAPEDATLRVAQETMTARWADEKRLLEDQILISDAENQLEKIALLEPFAERVERAGPARGDHWNPDIR